MMKTKDNESINMASISKAVAIMWRKSIFVAISTWAALTNAVGMKQ